MKQALRVLEDANLIRNGDDGYRIPTPAEDDWDRLRNGTSPKPSDAKRLHREVLIGFWRPQPTFTLDGVKPFKAGLAIDGHEEEKGDLMVHVLLAQEGQEYDEAQQELRARSQREPDAISWAVPLDDAIDRETVELFAAVKWNREEVEKPALLTSPVCSQKNTPCQAAFRRTATTFARRVSEGFCLLSR